MTPKKVRAVWAPAAGENRYASQRRVCCSFESECLTRRADDDGRQSLEILGALGCGLLPSGGRSVAPSCKRR